MNRESKILAIMALLSLAGSIFFGLLGAIYYSPHLYPTIESFGMTLQHIRPLHTSMAIAWIFMAGMAVVYYQIKESCDWNNRQKRLFDIHTILWGVSGVGITITLLMGNFSGREYIGHHPFFSLLIFIGWLLYAWNFLGSQKKSFWSAPVYRYMWTTSIFLFMYSYLEAHSWLLPLIIKRPIVDIQLQWKSMGQFVGTFNLLVYGSLIYINEKISGDKQYAHSKKAFLLFGLGLLNTFTNFAHHTYHLPQSQFIKWISFIVSMLEFIILFCVVGDIISSIKQKAQGNHNLLKYFFLSCKFWTFINLFLALLISIPPLNTIIHGTHVIFAHAMGSMIGIDSVALIGCLLWFVTKDHNELDKKTLFGLKHSLKIINISLFCLVFFMTVYGITKGIYRYMDWTTPELMEQGQPYVLMIFGLFMAIGILNIIKYLLKMLHVIPQKMDESYNKERQTLNHSS